MKKIFSLAAIVLAAVVMVGCCGTPKKAAAPECHTCTECPVKETCPKTGNCAECPSKEVCPKATCTETPAAPAETPAQPAQ